VKISIKFPFAQYNASYIYEMQINISLAKEGNFSCGSLGSKSMLVLVGYRIK
jgi:hypothetical protein